MSAWQRFFLLIIFCAGVMICFPQYDKQGFSFMLTAFCLWTCLIILLSIIVNLLGIYKFDFLHRIISLIFLAVMLGSLLYYFPLPNQQTPLSRLKNKQYPTSQDMNIGIRKLTFNFDFFRQNFQKKEETIKKAVQKAKETSPQEPQEEEQQMEIIMETDGE